jgi:quinohemoprotein ethanol dehydrogenase
LTHGLTYAEQRFSPLDQINEHTVAKLSLAWSFDTGTDRGLEATPLAVDGVLYFTGSWSIVFAVDARTGKLLWKWDPKVDQAEYGAKACCDVVNRGVAVYRGKVYVGVLDGRLTALAAKNGSVVWEVLTVDRSKPYIITGAPRIVKGQVIIGNSGADMGVRGYVSAYDANTGVLRWRFYTVPGDPAKPFESDAMAKAAATWKGRWWEVGGGGTVWDAMAFDPDLNLLYVGTGNGSPWNRHIRSPGGGDNLYLASILALNPDDGQLVWYYQTTPGETWDYTATQHIVLADLELGGRTRQVLMQAPKNGFFYVLDRRTGELISAASIVRQTWTTGIDLKTGRPREAPGADYRDRPAHIRPGTLGAHNWQPMSYNPRTGLMYIPAQENIRYFEQDRHFVYQPNMATMMSGTYPAAGILPEKVPLSRLKERTYAGNLLAWDPVAQRERWRVSYPNHWNGGTLSTAGNLVLQGTAAGTLAVYRATDGQKLWERWVGASVMAPPVTYLVNGVQQISILVGFGGGFGRGARHPGKLLTFALGGTAPLPDRPAPERVRAIAQPASAATIARGGALFEMYCARCHGGGTTLKDLRYSAEGVFSIYPDIVLKGIMVDAGMRSFGSVLDEGDVAAIRAWVVNERRKIAAGVK